MAKLKLGPIPDEKPVRLTTELPAAVYRDLVAYAEVLSRETEQAVKPEHLIAPMVARFMATDRGFAKVRKPRTYAQTRPGGGPPAVPPLGREPRSESA